MLRMEFGWLLQRPNGTGHRAGLDLDQQERIAMFPTQTRRLRLCERERFGSGGRHLGTDPIADSPDERADRLADHRTHHLPHDFSYEVTDNVTYDFPHGLPNDVSHDFGALRLTELFSFRVAHDVVPHAESDVVSDHDGRYFALSSFGNDDERSRWSQQRRLDVFGRRSMYLAELRLVRSVRSM